MTFPWLAFVYAMGQITVISVLALLLGGCLRGRHPQWSTSMYSGASLASILIIATAAVPATQWSWIQLWDPANTCQDYIGQDGMGQDLSGISSEDGGNAIRNTDDESPHTTLALGNFGATMRNPASGAGDSADPESLVWMRSQVDRMYGWAKIQFRHFDDRVHQLERDEESRFPWIHCVPMILFGGFLFFCLHLWMSWRWIRRVVRHSHRIESQALQQRLVQLCHAMGVRRVPELRESIQIPMGATVGHRRSYVLLNPTYRDWNSDELDAVLLHELAHIVRSDYAWVLVGRWTKLFFFYHPLMLLLVRRWRMDQELAADQFAASAMKNARTYGRALARLALRNQPGKRVPSPVLTAEQICIVRRIMMLMQGSMLPARPSKRWPRLWIAATLFVLAPLTGVRGVPPAADEETQSTVSTALGSSEASAPADEVPKDDSSSDVANDSPSLPSYEMTGRLKWEPAKLVTGGIDPSLVYLQDLAAFTFFEQFPERATIHCPTKIGLHWESSKDERAQLTMGAMWNAAHGIDSSVVARMLFNPMLGKNWKLSPETRHIQGYQARGLLTRVVDEETKTSEWEHEPSKWLIQDGEHCYFGTEEEILKQLSSDDGHANDDALLSVPDVFAEDYERSGVAVVHSECGTWLASLRTFVHGSEKENELVWLYPVLSGLEHLGVFLIGDDQGVCKARFCYSDRASASRSYASIASLLALANANHSEVPEAMRQLVSSMHIEVDDQEVRLRFNNMALLHAWTEFLVPETISGWRSVLASATPREAKGEIRLIAESPFASTGFLAQAVRADEFRGKRVRMTAELGCEGQMHNRTGLVIWGTSSDAKTIGNATSGNSIGNPIDPTVAMESLLAAWSTGVNQDAMVWKETQVEWEVPHDTDILSYAVYTSAGQACVRNVKLEIVGPTINHPVAVSLKALPRGLLHPPGVKVLEAPTNLEMDALAPTTPSDNPQVRSANRAPEDRSDSVKR